MLTRGEDIPERCETFLKVPRKSGLLDIFSKNRTNSIILQPKHLRLPKTTLLSSPLLLLNSDTDCLFIRIDSLDIHRGITRQVDLGTEWLWLRAASSFCRKYLKLRKKMSQWVQKYIKIFRNGINLIRKLNGVHFGTLLQLCNNLLQSKIDYAGALSLKNAINANALTLNLAWYRWNSLGGLWMLSIGYRW